MKKKKIKWVVLAAALLMALAAAAFVKKGEKEQVSSGESSYYKQTMGLAFLAQDGFFHTDNRNFLYFYDFEKELDVIVCNKPDCHHEETQEDTPDEEKCNAYLNGMVCGFVFEKQLYIIEIDPMMQRAEIIRSRLDRSGQKKVGELSLDYLDTFVVEDGFLYLAGSVQEMDEDETGMAVPSGRSQTWLYRVDLETGKAEKVTEESIAFNASLQIVGAADKKIYCRYSYFDRLYDGTNFEEAGAHTRWFVYDPGNGDYKEFLPESGFGGGFYVNGSALLYDESEEDGVYTVWQADLKTGEAAACAVSDIAPLYGDGKAFIKNQGQYQYYDSETKKTENLNHKLLDQFYFWQDAGEYFYGALKREGSQGDMPCFIRKKDFYRGKDRFIPLAWTSPEASP